MTSERESICVRKLANLFHCGKSQISTILKNKAMIKQLYESNASSDLCQARKRIRSSEYSDLNDALYQWYQLCVKKNMYPDGSLLAEKALMIAQRLGHTEFKASNGWLHRWKVRNNIKQRKICGESGDVRSDTVESWKERLPELVGNYNAQDIWNMDETGCFWRALPDKGLAETTKECKGGKQSKHRVTIAFFVNGAGESESPPIVIWKSNNPRCFKGVKKESLPVRYYSQAKCWMTGEILSDILSYLNQKLRSKGRSVLLFMDNAGCHPSDMADKYSNIKVLFLPPNTTSKLQPLDLGIIQNFKLHYRKLLMRFVLTKIEECATASEVVKSLNILHAIRWIAGAWGEIGTLVIKKCFRKAGILDQSFEVVRVAVSTEDPFLDLDNVDDMLEDDGEIQALVEQMGVANPCTTNDLAMIDDDLATCDDLSDENWEETFLSEICPSTSKSVRSLSPDIESESSDEESTVPEIPTARFSELPEAIASLEDVHQFLDLKGHTREATQAMSLIDSLSRLHSLNLSKPRRQTSLLEFLPNTS